VSCGAAEDHDGLGQLGNEEMHCVAGGECDEADMVCIEAHKESCAHEEELDVGVDDRVVEKRRVEVEAVVDKGNGGLFVADEVAAAIRGGAREVPRY